jgi:hypothetical protein
VTHLDADPAREAELDRLLMDRCAAACCRETATLMTEWLDRALHGDSWARDASTREVWVTLLDEARQSSINADFAWVPSTAAWHEGREPTMKDESP